MFVSAGFFCGHHQKKRKLDLILIFREVCPLWLVVVGALLIVILLIERG